LPTKSDQTREAKSWDFDLVNALAESSRDCLWVLTLDGRLAYMNPRARDLLSAAPDAQFLRDIWPEDSRFSLDRALAAAASGQDFRFRTLVPGPNQDRTYWETVLSPVRGRDGALCNLFALARDVTSEVETSAFLETVIQLLPSPLTVKNAGDRRFVLVNRAAEDLLDVSAEDALGRTAQELFGDDPRTFRETEAEVLGAGELRKIDHEVAAEDGGPPRHFSLKFLATHDDLGPRHLITLGDDVTERRATAESLGAALAAARQASEAKSAFLANMTHELRTPLNGIVAGADMLARGELSERSRDLVDMIRASSETLQRLLSDVLDLARAESGKIALETETFHVGDAVRSAAALFRLGAEEKGLTLEVEVDPAADGLALGDLARLRQVLSNLLSNAVKFTEHGRVVLRAARRGDIARFTVEDTGLGFDPAQKARLFGRFQQADDSFTRRFGGAGLGLAISRELVELMGGTLDGDSVPGRGATFWFEAPLPIATSVAPAPSPTLPPDNGLRILLADDHPTNRQVVQLMLSGVADIVSVENGAEAVEAFRDRPFDLVLMDMQMPIMDGLTAIRELRRMEAASGRRGRVPMIMLTANTQPEHVQASAEAGADRHLGKPVTTRALFEAIETLLGQSEDDHTLYANFGHGGP
jgi:signal transduction histidine kinase/AmiR/NasT family two-component response regulator